MRIVFAGTPEFAARALSAILVAGHEVVGVLTQPDRRAGRGMRLVPSAVKQRAQADGLTVSQLDSLRGPDAQRELAAWFAEARAEVMVVAAYGLLLPSTVLQMPRLGCINIHASMLPRWRGAAPVERAILAGDVDTGACIMQMDAGLDTGPVLLAQAEEIKARDTAGELRGRLANLGASAIVEVLAALERGEQPVPRPQAETGVTYANKISKAEAILDFDLSAIELDRRIRAFDPAPGAVAMMRGSPIKIWRARPGPFAQMHLSPGTVRGFEDGGLGLSCGLDGRDTLIIEELQRPGGRRLPATQFLAGHPIPAGERFASNGK